MNPKNKIIPLPIITMIMILIFMIVPAGKIHAASWIKVLSTSQQNKIVNIKWEKVKGASYYTIWRKFSDAATGKLDNKSKVTWKQTSNVFKDETLTTADNGKVICYHISAIDKNGKEMLRCTRFFMKIPTCSITSVSEYDNGKVTFKWRSYNYIKSYTLKLVEGTDFNSSSVKIKTVDGSKSSVTISGMKPGKTYSLKLYGNASGLYQTKIIESTGWYSTKTINIPTEDEIRSKFFKTNAKIILHNNDGSVYKDITVDKGSDYTIPSMLNPKGYTFIGWGPKKNIIVSEAAPYKGSLQAYEEIKNLQGETHLYAILSDRNKEKDLTAKQMLSPNISKYKKIIFVGDSRMERTQTLMNSFCPNYKNLGITFVAKGGSGAEWLKDEGYPLILKEIEKTDSKDKRPIAIIFNSGVNRLTLSGGPTAQGLKYLDFYKSIEQTLKSKGCKLYIMSVNPMVSGQYKSQNSTNPREEWRIRTVNDMLYNGLSSTYGYINTYDWLLETGFGTSTNSKENPSLDDGLHYTEKTYKRIIWKALTYLDSH